MNGGNKKRFFGFFIVTVYFSIFCLSQLAFLVPVVSGYGEMTAHPYMSEASLDLLPYNSEMYSFTSQYLDQIKAGSTDEDHTDHVYRDLTLGWKYIEQFPHFWDADAGKDKWVSFPMLGSYPNAYMKAVELFERALERYSEGRIDVAYERIGHLAHLIQDMTVPAHTHIDYHPAIAGQTIFTVIPGSGDDCYEDFWKSNFYVNNNFEHQLAAEAYADGLIDFPTDVETQLRSGNWNEGVFYLMYTANQCADYFASDDKDGDTDDYKGWMDYSGWPDSPTKKEDLEDNDEGFLGDTLQDRDTDDDGDLSNISHYSFAYAIRAVATLYKIFYEITHPPEASINIVFADNDQDGAADYKWVRLDVTYDCGAAVLYQDLEAQFRNEDGEWTDWIDVGGQPIGRRVSWVLSEGDGRKRD